MARCLVALFLPLLFACNVSLPEAVAPVRWTAVNVSTTQRQGDANFLLLPKGERILIDVGDDNGLLLNFLRERGISHIDEVFITHAHRDHYGGLRSLLAGNILMKRVRMNIPMRTVCDREGAWGCNYEDVLAVVALLKQHRVPVKPVLPGDEIRSGAAALRVLYAFNGVDTPIGPTDINDMSAQMLLSIGHTRVLFTGDLNRGIGEYLAGQGKELAADILKVPHHGGESMAPNRFFDRVGARVAIVPAPASLWESPRSVRARDYFKSQGTTVYVNGLHGHIDVLLSASDYSVQPSNTFALTARSVSRP